MGCSEVSGTDFGGGAAAGGGGGGGGGGVSALLPTKFYISLNAIEISKECVNPSLIMTNYFTQGGGGGGGGVLGDMRNSIIVVFPKLPCDM